MAAKLYLVVRSDLPVAQQAVQAAHALQEYNERHRESAAEWYQSSNHLAILSVPDEAALRLLEAEAERKGLKSAPFREPDRADELTAIALEPSAKRICSRLRLALSE